MKRREFLLNCTVMALVAERNALAESLAPAEQTVLVGDAQFQLALSWGATGLKEKQFHVDQRQFANLTGVPWVVEIDGNEFTPEKGSVRLVSSGGNRPARGVIFEGDVSDLSWRLKYEVTGAGRITKSLSLTSKKQTVLRRISLWTATSEVEPIVARTQLQDVAALYRQDTRGLFVSLDFPYSKIETAKTITSVSYPPHELLTGSQVYACHSLTFGAIRLLGRERYGYDEGEVASMDAYVQQRHQPRFERPMFCSSSIVNRYTQVEGDTIFYTMKDHPTLSRNTHLLKRDLALLPKLGMEYYQVFPGVFDWVPDDPSPKTVEELMSFARGQGVRMGDYSGANYLFCPHYNEYRNSLNRPEWLMQDKNGKSKKGLFCFGHPEFVKYYRETVVATCRRYGFEIHCLDFLYLQACYAPSHGHPLGADGVYHQVKGLVDLLEAINSVSPQMMTWSNSGNWKELLPKLAWSNPNLYLTDPFINTPWQGLNMTRLLDDARREQMVSLHHTHFLPYRFFTNCQYFFSQNSVVPDIRNFEYGALSTLAVTPNLTLAEIRPWLDRLSSFNQERVIQFYRRWTDFVHQHYEFWKKTYQAGENPGVGAVEIYGHAIGNRGFVFVINPQYWDRTIEIPLDDTLGFPGTGQCEISELYPVERLRLTPQGPIAAFGTRVPITVPAQEVVVLEVRPAPLKIEAARMYGLQGTIDQTSHGYLIKTQGAQGRTERFAVLFPPGGPTIVSVSVRPDIPSQPKRHSAPTPLKLLNQTKQGVLLEVTFRRDSAPKGLREWRVEPCEFTKGIDSNRPLGFTDGAALKFPLFVNVQDSFIHLPLTDTLADKVGLGPLANFCGAYVDNAFSEMQETWIELKTGEAALQGGILASKEKVTPRRPLHPFAKHTGKSWWLQSSFHLPFMYTIGAESAFEDHPILALPQIRQKQLKEIKAWINGTELKVQRYNYPRERKLGCYYADLVGSGARAGKNELVIYLQY